MTNPDTINKAADFKAEAAAVLKYRGIKPDTDAAHDVWFRRFEDDVAGTVQEITDAGDVLAWLYDTAEVAAEPDTNYTTPAGRRIARKLLKQFA